MRRPLRFLLVGAWNTLFGFGVFTGLWYAARPLGLHYAWVAGASNLIAVTSAYVCYKVFVFRTRGEVLREYLRFWASYAVIIAVQFAALALCVSLLQIQPVIAQALVLAVSVSVSWLLHNFFTFRRADGQNE